MRASCVSLLLLLSHGSSLRANDPQAPPPLPQPVASFGAAVAASGEIFIYGGHSGVRHKYNREDVKGTLHAWSPGDAAWRLLSTDEPAQGASLIATKTGIIRIGGMAARNERGTKQDLWSTDTAAVFQPGDNSWRRLPKMPERRSSHDSALVGDMLYVMGGWSMHGGSSVKWHDTYLTFDLSRSDATWEIHPQPFKRRAVAVQAVGSRLYVIGGMTSDDEMSGDVTVLDAVSGKWSDGPKLPTDKLGGFGFAAVSHEGRLFASGAPGVLLELRGDGWIPVAKLEHPRFFHRLVPGGKGHLIALGGESRDGKKPPPEAIEVPAPDSPPLANAPTEGPANPPAASTRSSNLPPAQSDWPRYQGPRGDGTTPEVGWRRDWPADGPPVLWSADVGKGLSSFAVVGSRAYTSGNDGADHDTIWCLDLETGKPVWEHTYDAPTQCHVMPIVPRGPAATPTITDGKLWFISRHGDLICLKSDTGALVWQKRLVEDLGGKRPVYGYSNSPLIHGTRLYLDVGGNGKSNACLDANTGGVIWQTGDGEAGYATPQVIQRDSKEVLVMFKGEALELRSASDGTLLARFPTETTDFCNCATPVFWKDTIFVAHTGSNGAHGLTWSGTKLSEQWNDRSLGLLFHSGVRVADGRLLAFNDSLRGANELRLLDLATGKNIWTEASIEKGTILAPDDGHAILLTNKGELVLARVLNEKLDILQRVQVLPAKCWVQPVLAHRRLLCRNNDGKVVCLDLR